MPSDIDTITHAIQLALAPVFLLVAVGSLLGGLTTRLSRAVDRSRVLHGRVEAGGDAPKSLAAEMLILARRMRIINAAIICALLICTVVAIIFLASIVSIAVTAPIVWCFVAGMSCLIGALLCLLREIYLATMKMPICY